MHYLNIRKLAVLLAVLFLVSILGQPKAIAASRKGDMTLRESALFFASVARHVRLHHVESATNEELLEGALNGMLGSLDPHSGYLSPKQFTVLKNQTRGKFSGLGVEVTMTGGLIKVITPLDDTPAFEAGLQSGDLIVRINEHPVHGLTLMKAVELLRGKPNTDVEVTVRRANQPDFVVKITRALIKIHPVKARLEGNVGYIRIKTFNRAAGREVRAAVEKFRKQLGPKLEGIVIDVRNNAGGLLDQAVEVSDVFLDGGNIVSIKTRGGKRAQHFKAKTPDLTQGVPIVVLINGGSASAAEIVAGAIQDRHRGIVVGTRSFGKASVQSVVPLKNGGAIKLTTALYYTPSGRSIQKKGIKPDIEIDQSRKLTNVDEGKRLRESHFMTAIEPSVFSAPKPSSERKSSTKTNKNKKNQKAGDQKPEDYQLKRAIDVLRGISFYKRTRKVLL